MTAISVYSSEAIHTASVDGKLDYVVLVIALISLNLKSLSQNLQVTSTSSHVLDISNDSLHANQSQKLATDSNFSRYNQNKHLLEKK